MATICWIADFEVLKALLLRWLVYCHIAFFMFENVYFLALRRHLNPGITRWIPGRKTIRDWVIDEFARRNAFYAGSFAKLA
jgi:hypothetical protein